jgi:hypothetical protein
VKYPAAHLIAWGLRRGGAWRALAPWMRRRVIRAGDAGDQNAVDAAWQVWLARPDEKLWQALQRWRRMSEDLEFILLSQVALGAPRADTWFRDALIRAESRQGHPISDIARERILAEADDQELVDAVCAAAMAAPATSGLAAWCAGQGLAPADRAGRAAFFVATGQAAQYRAEDPDGSLLRLAYQTATGPERERLRAAIADAGDLDLLRLVASASVSSPRPTTAGEARYLAGRLAARRDWDGLWRLAQRLPLAQAVAAMRSFDEAFRPAGDAERELFTCLAGTSPEPFARARDALLASSVRPVGAGSRACSMSPDGRELAAVGAPYYRPCLDFIELPSLVRRQGHVVEESLADVLHLGDGVLVWTWYSVFLHTRDGGEQLYPDEVRLRSGVRFCEPQRHPDGFVALLSTAHPNSDCLRFATASGQVIRDVPLPSLGIAGQGVTLCAVDPGTGRLALSNGHRLWIVDGDPDGDPAGALEVTGSAPWQTHYAGGSFVGPGRLVTSSYGADRVDLWGLDGGSPELRVTRQLRSLTSVAALGHDMVAAAEPQTSAVKLLDSETLETLAEVTVPEKFEDYAPRQLRAAPGSRFVAAQQPGNVSLIDAGAVALACRPLGVMTAQHWALAMGLLEDSGTDEAARDFLVLLRDVLGARLGGEVALGDGAPAGGIGAGALVVGDDEIGLEGSGGGRS